MTDTFDRGSIRNAFADILETALVGTGKPAQAVYPYFKAKLEGRSPVVCVISAGIERKNRALSNPSFIGVVKLLVKVFVLKVGKSWTEEQSENSLDTIEQSIAKVVIDNRVDNDHWQLVSFGDSSAIHYEEIDGLQYWVEDINLNFLVSD